jgi:hypothetical protein
MRRDRAYRRMQRKRILAKRKRFWLSVHRTAQRYCRYDTLDSKLVGRWAKHKPLDCGQSRCWLCHHKDAHNARNYRQQLSANYDYFEVFGEYPK